MVMGMNGLMGMNGFHALAVLLAAVASIIQGKDDPRPVYRLIVTMTCLTAAIVAAAAIGATEIFRNSLLLKFIFYIVTPAAATVYLRHRRPQPVNQTITTAVIGYLLAVLSAATAG